MAKIIENIEIEDGFCKATIYLQFLGEKLRLMEKFSDDCFKTVNIKEFDDVNRFCFDGRFNGYMVYDLLTSIKDAMVVGNYVKMYSFVSKFNDIEKKVLKEK